ncbi:hypothetical protein F0U61_14765 [Archangium violaceum]|uniref:CARDB domain-containing protein n=1 Tax=Archangium violaceum TaxID=83451 RepID=UPI002B2C59CD|nr:hypothetical protein F0U61_14765 [Archangium violaceum]
MRMELALLRNMWPAVWLSAALVAGCGDVDVAPTEGRVPSAGHSLEEERQPDLVVTAVETPPSARPGDDVTASARVCNQGTEWGEAQVHFYLSADEVLSADDTWVGDGWLTPLHAGRCSTQSVQFTAPDEWAALHRVVAVVESKGLLPESDGSNNLRAGPLLGVGYKPDFVVTAVDAPASLRPWEFTTAAVTVCNQGTEWGQLSVELLLSPDPASLAGARHIGAMPGVEVWPGTCVTQDAFLNVPEAHDTPVHLVAVVNRLSSWEEFSEANNVYDAGPRGVGDGPDLVISEVTAPSSSLSDASFTSRVTLCNQGTQGAEGAFRLVLSSDSEISEMDALLAAGNVGPLEPGQCATQDVAVQASLGGSESASYLGAIAGDGYTQDLNANNNTRATGPIAVGSGPDFVISQLSVPPSVSWDAGFPASITVCNQGTLAGATDAGLFLVTGPDDQPSEFMAVGALFTGYLEPGQCATQALFVGAWPTNAHFYAPWHLMAVADRTSAQWELVESNNSRTSSALVLE